MSGRLIRQRLLTSTTVAGAVLLALPAFAQTTQEAPISPAADNPAPSAPAPSSADGSEDANTSTAGNDIVVTGSRIPRPELESASPITVVGAAEVAISGATRTEDLLNSLPQVFASQGGSISNGATGTATVDLRGLGSVRTLVLVNGRRLVPGDPRSPVADINIIPAALIKKIDVLTGGASSVYGADAVTGVVNFVMDTEFDGFKIDGQYSFYQHNNRNSGSIPRALAAQGYSYPRGSVADGGAVDASAIFGAGFDDGRGHVTAYASYRKIDPVTQDKRDYSSCSLSGNNAANTQTLGRRFNCGGSPTSAPGSFYTQGSYYNVQGNQFIPGQVLYNFAPTNYFQRPDERYSAGFFAHYDVADEFKPYAEFMFMDDRTVAQIAPSGLFIGNTSSINCDNPLLSAQQVGIVCAPGTTFEDDFGVERGTLYIGRRNVEGGGRQDDLQHTTYRGVIGAKGDLFKGILYDASYQYGRVNFAQTYRNDFSITRSARAIDVVTDPTTGAAVCRSVLNGTDPNCVPYNIFQTGGVTQAALNYLQVPLFSRGQNTEQVANANITFLGGEYGIASPFATEGFGLNVGYEYRKETLNFEVDENFLTGDGAGQGGATTPTAGQLKVSEFFAEASLPIVQDRPFFQELYIGGGYRRSSYDVAGNGVSNSFDTDTYKVEGRWAPIRDLKFRGTYSRSVRAPNVVELFSAQSIQLAGSSDPCTTTANGDGTISPPEATLAQCQLTGMTAAQYGNIQGNPANQYNGLAGGNPNLEPEVADSFTAGVVITPSFLRGFQLTVDYFNIKLKKQIGTLGYDFILNSCLQTGQAQYCSLVNRGASGRLDRNDGFVQVTQLNTGALKTSGIDVAFGYTQEIASAGTLGLSLAGTWLDKLISAPLSGGELDCAGRYGANCQNIGSGVPAPEWRHKARATFTLAQGPSISAAWRYFTRVRNDGAPGAGGNPANRVIGAQSYFDLALTAPVADKFTFQLGVNNILDREPPINGLNLPVIGNGNTFPQVYDALGRYMFAGVTLDF